MTKERAIARAAELIESLELADCADRPTKTYSGDRSAVFDIGIGLMHLPQLLFLDEAHHRPRSTEQGSDVGRGAQAARHRDDGVPHDALPRGADALSDRIAIIDHGKIVALGTPMR